MDIVLERISESGGVITTEGGQVTMLLQKEVVSEGNVVVMIIECRVLK